MMLWMAFGLIAGLFGIVHVVFIREANTPHTINNKALERLAHELGIKFTSDKTRTETEQNALGQLSGTIEQFRVTVREERMSDYGNLPYCCVYEVETRGHSLSDALLIYREGPPSKVGKILGGEDIEVGHPEIDQAFVIRDTSPISAQEMFALPDVAEAFMALTTLTPKITFKKHKLSLIHTGTRLDAQQARVNIAALMRCALLLCESTHHTSYHEINMAQRLVTQGTAPTWQSAP